MNDIMKPPGWIFFGGRLLPKYAAFLDVAAHGYFSIPVDEKCSLWFWHFSICMGCRNSAPSQEVRQHAGTLLRLLRANSQQLEAEVERHFQGGNAPEILQDWCDALEIMMEVAATREECVWTGELADVDQVPEQPE